MKSLKARVFMVLSALALLTTVVLTTPASTVQAKNVTESLMSNQKVNDVVQNIDEEDMEKAKRFVKEALITNDDFTYSVDRQKAIQIGFTVDQVTNMALFYENLPSEQVKFLEEGKQVNGDQQIKPMFVPALPWVVYITLQELLAILTAVGLAGVAQAFLKDIYTHGIKQACKKFSKKHKKIKQFCKNNGYPTK
ncbi:MULTISPECIES: hypothetical protein [Bacillus]|uniref:Uncharacterized protein n=2 Tax=Bacillus glycinifermentans TaxID=1664069 RepID=A0AAJ3YZV2_9BACI|nr:MULTISPECIES: hypothetical protein [Bacillus]KKB72500.1 hypothetical protein TH62_16850 [Bacillus sp. TH008]MBU8786790.1 hypothetical protein [Bacillus glycinifermentans]MDU0070020.1 hypothetical protein [Bacillus sp. IG6]MED8017693.1 hypothetical protein [Bacillus glycinifermentans]QAT66364.1 hypothetical protein EQZ20_16645 [Bacillus glycinifermentans]